MNFETFETILGHDPQIKLLMGGLLESGIALQSSKQLLDVMLISSFLDTHLHRFETCFGQWAPAPAFIVYK